ncbi:MAG: hypothetical protein WBF50_16640, partial [Pseudolabrys sp.]
MADKLGNNKKANWHGQQFEAGYQRTRAAYGLKIERHCRAYMPNVIRPAAASAAENTGRRR